MIKKALLISTCFLLTVSVFAKINIDDIKAKPRGWTPFRLCVTEGAWAWPEKKDVYGLNLGLLATYNYNSIQKIYGVDFSFVIAEAKVNGLQMTMTNWSKGSNGVQLAFGNMVEDFGGVQVALANLARESSVCQIGVLNFARKNTKGFQFGVLNFMDNGFLPFFPIFNFGF